MKVKIIHFIFIQESDRLVMLDAPELEKMKEEGLIVNGRTERYVPTLQYVLWIYL